MEVWERINQGWKWIKRIIPFSKLSSIKELKEIIKTDPFIIHYSCHAIGSNEPENIKITGITIQCCGQSHEDNYDDYDYKNENQSDEEEAFFLKEFFLKLSQNHSKNVLCWHMNSKDYGIEHLKSRYFKLTREQANCSHRFYSIPTFLQRIYPKEFEKLNHPKMENLFKANSFNILGFVSGEKEKDEICPYKLRASRKRKVSNFYSVIQKILENELKF